MKKVELLAPAGDFEGLRAALVNGADAVYLGGKDFSARAYASNFDRATIAEAVKYSHLRGMKVYVTINTLLKDVEINKLLDYVAFLYENDVDALIIQDIGVLSLISYGFPDFELHCSTQMTLHNTPGIEAIKSFGVKRVVVARELNIKEIQEIYNNTGMELEVFIHGALCVSYSGQCLISSYIGGRSGNRGRCAQPCRRSYELLGQNNKKLKKEAYHISMRDLNTIKYIDKLIEGGVASFKIEGRMKKPHYVAAIVRSYRQAIDRYLISKQMMDEEKVRDEIAQVFNRRFTRGFILESPKEEIVNIEKPSNRGVYLGEVLWVDKGRNTIRLKLEKPLAVGDGIEALTSSGKDVGGAITTITINNKKVHKADKNETVEIVVKGNVNKGDKIFKTHDAVLTKQLQETYENKDITIKLKGEITIEIDKAIKLYIWDELGNGAYQESEFIVEKAIKAPLTEERIRDNLNKLGGTPFVFEYININLEKGASAPIATINGLRRGAIEKLSDIKSKHHPRKMIKEIVRKPFRMPVYKLAEGKDIKTIKTSLRVDTIKQLKSINAPTIDRVYYGDLNTLDLAIDFCKGKGWNIFFRSPNIVKDKDYNYINEKLKHLKIDGILAGDIGMVKNAMDQYSIPVIADYTLNPFNSYSLDTLLGLGVTGVVISTELDLKSIGDLLSCSSMEIEVIVYGKLMAMTLEYCPLNDVANCINSCNQCSHIPYSYRWGLRDHKNMIFPIAKDFLGRTIVLNSQPLFMLDKLKEIKKVNPHRLQVSITDEDTEKIKKIPLNMEGTTRDLPVSFTRGHYFRGVE
ncbi:U32 family peptidase [Alkaliphilus pronyensis]|uniref:U32 family peptidase n=1 Tax=Alkaliphilus pronyensis TaxID=1482732 RepID=A0A6I0FCE5_9FIRM|nr:U32 family peptidase [Alkaliphilus pronyensis]KAB3535420.1 U32 family peptidase [Alkaliphilus pronyensis]